VFAGVVSGPQKVDLTSDIVLHTLIIPCDVTRVKQKNLGNRPYFADSCSDLLRGFLDIAIAPLMIHHVTERVTALREVARVLKAGGYLIVSTSHPFADWKNYGGSYFATELVQDTWSRSSQSFQLPFWRMSLSTLCDEFAQAGFYIDKLLERNPNLLRQKSIPRPIKN
jgi:SAM-dependent methyltransferase